MRYVVTEIEGYAIRLPMGERNGSAKAGLSVQVVDTAWNHSVVAVFRSETGQSRWGVAGMREYAREQARTRCDLLNRLDEIARSAA